jgi:hypothetical protein
MVKSVDQQIRYLSSSLAPDNAHSPHLHFKYNPTRFTGVIMRGMGYLIHSL